MKKTNLFLLVLVFITSMFLFSAQTMAEWNIGIGHQIEEKEFDYSYKDGSNSGSVNFNSPIDCGKIIFGFDINKSISMDFSLYRSSETTVFQQSMNGSLGYNLGFGDAKSGSFFQIDSNPTFPSILVSGNLDSSTKMKYRTSGGSAEFVYNFPSAWSQKDVIRFKGFLGYTESRGVMTTNFNVSSRIGNTDGEILIPVKYIDDDAGNVHTDIYDFLILKIPYDYFYTKNQDGTYSKWQQKFKLGKFSGWSSSVVNEIPKGEEITSFISIPIEKGNDEFSHNFSVIQRQEMKGTYVGLSATYDIIKNFDMELAARHVIYGSVENKTSGSVFSSKLEDDRPDITMVDLTFTAHFVKGVDFKAIYSKTFANYELGDVKFNNDETGRISLVLDYKF